MAAQVTRLYTSQMMLVCRKSMAGDDVCFWLCVHVLQGAAKTLDLVALTSHQVRYLLLTTIWSLCEVGTMIYQPLVKLRSSILQGSNHTHYDHTHCRHTLSFNTHTMHVHIPMLGHRQITVVHSLLQASSGHSQERISILLPGYRANNHVVPSSNS